MNRLCCSQVASLSLLVLICLNAVAQSPPSTSQPVRFTHVDIVIDPHGTPLAAYELEFIADPARVTLVGIEGGEHPAFKQPPYYDPKALSGNRVILAALNTGTDLPSRSTRVARLHLRIVGSEQPTFQTRLIVAASAADRAFPADVKAVSEGANP